VSANIVPAEYKNVDVGCQAEKGYFLGYKKQTWRFFCGWRTSRCANSNQWCTGTYTIHSRRLYRNEEDDAFAMIITQLMVHGDIHHPQENKYGDSA